MELNTTLLIDVGLNVVGFLAAAALTMVMYAMFRRERRRAPESPATMTPGRPAATTDAAEPTASRPRTAAGAGQYLSFSGERSEAAGEKPGSLTLRRNRAEVLRMARAMIQQGATDEQIKESLPVSDSELAVLNYERK